MIDGPLLERLYRQADAARWSLPDELFRETLETAAGRAFPGAVPAGRELERQLSGLHLGDLALACACAHGNGAAWDHFMAEHRPVLYRAADALDPSGGAREVADSLYAELYGLRGEGPKRASLFEYFHGRSKLSTWLRAVLAQRYVDWLRARRRTSPLDDEEAAAIPAATPEPDRFRFATLVGAALGAAVASLEPRERLRLKAYYEQDLTLAQIGRLTGEHEATVSRRIAKTRQVLRQAIERHLREQAQLDESEMTRCLASVMDDAGSIDLRELFGSTAGRKLQVQDRSQVKRP